MAPDITMCSGDGCPVKNNCRRHTATPDKLWQSWFSEVPYDHELEDCESFMPLKVQYINGNKKVLKGDKDDNTSPNITA